MLRVLLVCTGNICRSPIAHGLLADRSTRLLDGAIEVRSAGTWAREGSPATPEAVAAAHGLGLDISSHRTSSMRRELATWADLIVTMTAEQAEEVAEMAPEAEEKTFTLKELVPLLEDSSHPPAAAERDDILRRIGEAHRIREQRGMTEAARLTDVDVADPLGLSEIVYRAVAHEVEGLIDRLVTGLVDRRDATLSNDA